jgi:hypothetical protein
MADPGHRAAPPDLSNRDVQVALIDPAGLDEPELRAYELRAGEERIGELRLARASHQSRGLNEAEALTDEGAWRLRRPAAKLRPRIDVTELSSDGRVASYDSKVFGAGTISIAGSGTYVRPGSPRAERQRVETESGDVVLELDASGLPASATVAIGRSELPRRELVLLAVTALFARLIYHQLPRTMPIGAAGD